LISCSENEPPLEIDSTFVKTFTVDKSTTENLATTNYIANRYLMITKMENRMFFMADSLKIMKLSPVYIPEGPGFVPGNYNF
jgi:hypothetical protein